jgi:tetratricopeptide (TPR) repeat protein
LESLKALADSKLSGEHNKEVTAEQDAVTAAKKAIRAEPTDGFAWRKLGDAYLQLGDYKNAYDAMQEAIEIFREKFKKAPSPHECEAMKILAERQQPKGQTPLVCHDEAPTIVSMLASSYVQMADICEKLHKRHEARRYRDAALRAFDVLRMMHPSSQGLAANPGVEQPASQPRRVPALGTTVACPSPVHELCQGPAYGSSDWRDYNRCQAGNSREEAQYQRCLQEQRQRQRE